MLHKKSLDRIEAGLYVVATPIGNLRDVTLRALDVLSAADVVAAEDTRITRHLLAHYGIEAKIVSLREHNEVRRSDQLIDWMREGKSVALVTDAGTPGISDPGAVFVGRARQAGVPVWAIPGPSALTCALAGLGWAFDVFCFHGFLPQQPGARRRALQSLRERAPVMVFYEAPHRIEETLTDMQEAFGAERRCALLRELTKKFEQFKEGGLAQVRAWLAEDADRRRGEFVLVVEGGAAVEPAPGVDAERLLALLCERLPTKEAVRVAVELTGRKRNELYDLALRQQARGGSDSEES